MARMPDRTELIDAESNPSDRRATGICGASSLRPKQVMAPPEFVEHTTPSRGGKTYSTFLTTSRRAAPGVFAGDRHPTTADEQDAFLQAPQQSDARRSQGGSIRLAAFGPYEKDESRATLMYAPAAG